MNILVIAGDMYHPFETTKRALSFLEEFHELTYLEEGLDTPWESLDQYQVIILHKSGKQKKEDLEGSWMGHKGASNLYEYVRKGGHLVAMHNGIAGIPQGSALHRLLRGRFVYHPQEHVIVKYEWLNLDWALAFSALDEHYFVEVELYQTRLEAAATSSEHGTTPAAWQHSIGKGKVYCLTAGHTEGIHFTEGYRQAVKRAIS